MAKLPLRLLPVLLSVLPACNSTNYTADLATNEALYVDVPYTTKVAGDRAACVTPMADGRVATNQPNNERGFPVTYTTDDFWERPVTAMVGDVLTRQLADSELFTDVCEQPAPDALVIKPTLVSFLGGSAEAISGRCSFAEVAIRLQVYGPAGNGGRRECLLDQTYANKQSTLTELNPASPYKLIGRALQQTISRALHGLDGSNVARSTVPTGGDTPALGVPATPNR
ncbi:MAG: hypothetical protein FJ301_03770 [Planctomycetes bacterium]|nr:hypothetical protein [Planctomycetota bacterium]